MKLPVMPHCDQRVLHAPGACEYCDKCPEWQDARRMWGINFTGEHYAALLPCPAEIERSEHHINLWYGNRAKTS